MGSAISHTRETVFFAKFTPQFSTINMRAGLPALTHVSIRTIAIYHIILKIASVYYNIFIFKNMAVFSPHHVIY
jgi:hypothetical protein